MAKVKPLERLHGIICYWSFQKPDAPSKRRRDRCWWKLEESFAIDCDGHCLTDVSTGGDDRHEYHKWTHERVYYLEHDLSKLGQYARQRGPGEWFTKAELLAKSVSEEVIEALDEDWKPIMGRAVTIWSVESGIRLLDFHPPEWADWLSPTFFEKLCKLSNWSELLEGGYDLYLGTAREAERYTAFHEKVKE